MMYIGVRFNHQIVDINTMLGMLDPQSSWSSDAEMMMYALVYR